MKMLRTSVRRVLCEHMFLFLGINVQGANVGCWMLDDSSIFNF